MSSVDFLGKLLDGNVVEHIPVGRLILRIRDKGKNSPEIKTVYSVSNTQGLVKAEDFRDNTIHSEDTSNYTVVRRGMFAYNPARLNIGSIAFLKFDAPGLVSPMYVVFSVDEKIILKEYLNYFIKSSYCANKIDSLTEEGARFRFDFERWDLIDVPVPRLEVQSKIVRILDAFTELTDELTDELTIRKKQYNYYRDQLLSFEGGEVEWKTLGEVAQYSNTRIRAEKLNETNYVGVDNLLQNRAGKSSSSYVPTSGNLTEYQKNDILIGNIRPYLKKIWQSDCIGGTNGDVLVLRCTSSSINPRYLYQVLADDKFFDFNMQHAKGAKMPRGNKEEILKYQIPVPPPDEQARIVAILDKFDALTNSITEGLPREIELRQKQYVHYRDLLLSFQKPVGEIV